MKFSPRPVFILGGIVLAALCAAGFFFVFGQNKFRHLEAFPAELYLETPDALLGNRYVLDVWIESQLAWREDTGRLIEVRTAAGNRRLPVFVPRLLQQNLYVGQRYLLDVRVRDGGLIHVHNLDKY